VREINDAALVPDPTLTINKGAVVPWSMFGLAVMPQVKRQILYPPKNGKLFELNCTYRNARRPYTRR
jgi:excinuclease ABC subunit A